MTSSPLLLFFSFSWFLREGSFGKKISMCSWSSGLNFLSDRFWNLGNGHPEKAFAHGWKQKCVGYEDKDKGQKSFFPVFYFVNCCGEGIQSHLKHIFTVSWVRKRRKWANTLFRNFCKSQEKVDKVSGVQYVCSVFLQRQICSCGRLPELGKYKQIYLFWMQKCSEIALPCGLHFEQGAHVNSFEVSITSQPHPHWKEKLPETITTAEQNIHAKPEGQ